jgi:hypothetical protein
MICALLASLGIAPSAWAQAEAEAEAELAFARVALQKPDYLFLDEAVPPLRILPETRWRPT